VSLIARVTLAVAANLLAAALLAFTIFFLCRHLQPMWLKRRRPQIS